MFSVRYEPGSVIEEPTPIFLKRKRPVEVEEESDDDRHDEASGNDDKSISSDGENDSESESDSDSDSNMKSAEEDEDSDVSMDSHDAEVGDEQNDMDKHNVVLSRFQKTMSLQKQIEILEEQNEMEEDEDNLPKRDLDSIPQPAKVVDETARYAKSGEHKRTAWIHTKKIQYDQNMIKKFDEFSELLEPRLLQNIVSQFSAESFPIQTAIMEHIMPTLNFAYSSNKKEYTRRVGDILVNSSTGSGKTLAYSIPVVNILSKRTVNRLRAIVIVPTKMLVSQVYSTFSKLFQGTSVVVTTSKSETSLKEEHKKLKQLEPDVLIVTPGRLVDHLKLNSISLKNLKFLILDEADRLLNQSFQNWCDVLLSRISADKLDQKPGNVIKMVFSATLTTNTEKLNSLKFYEPKLFVMDTVKLYNLPKALQEYNLQLPTSKSLYKPLYLLRLLDKITSGKVLIFVKSNESSLRLASLLAVMIESQMGKKHLLSSINSNNTRSTNRKLLTDFAKTNENTHNVSQILITTDVMSRGIDINNVTDIINYDLPISSQQYVHRCGRTARANLKGNAYNIFVGKGEATFWNEHITSDISRDKDGKEPANWNETHDSETINNFIEVTKDYELLYKICLASLKEQASVRKHTT